MNLNTIEKIARQLFKGDTSAMKHVQLSESVRRAMQQWNTASQAQQGATATTLRADLPAGWLH